LEERSIIQSGLSSRLETLAASFHSRNALLELRSHALREAVTTVLGKCCPASNKESKPACFFLLHLDHDPLAVGSGLDRVNIDHGMAQWQWNAFKVSDSTSIIRKNGEVHFVPGTIEFAVS
jgi:hypothetical protein